MQALILSFIASALVSFLIVRYEHLHARYSGDHDLSGVQKFHVHIAPRIGGIAVLIGIFVGLSSRLWIDQAVWKLAMWVLIAALPAFGAGLIEDFTKAVSVRMRLLATFLSALIAGYVLDAWIVNVQIPGLDWLLSIPVIAIMFTCFAVAGLSNAFNLIDGYNGLVSGVGIIILLAIAYVGFCVHDYLIMACSFAGIGALVGFLLWNYPRGLLFLGDGGAYLLGFWIAELSILLVTRNPQVSKWFPVLVCIYPIFETLFTIYRRLVLKQVSAGRPDSVHLHQIIFRRLVRWSVGTKESQQITLRNSLTSIYLWLLCALAVIPAALFWNYHWVLKGFVVLFAISYVWLYRMLVKFKTPRYLIMRNP
ncbi:MraY family glycosyltransferase [Polynucleobacter asymbioticus]|jgi:UDP-N-acetylmuramyl pentapeptide phosphotransferase/UDP-N-acetylglucosamine-1-phosphate transferase|uniref:Glycosyl transferase n=1 Tax=Polynucleobacter asymbioticus TaxID=576611 RepID=A0AAC9IX41_9BURK|nr:glycosyltransferase [Polynucleobacter asymbioticus]APB98151.1 glycosyl transferase [Polynucleobacter asymbioticus]APC00437.1 glycosyl transferase [Polynucleobacter asymbioticus]